MTNRIKYIDIAKGIVILLVVLGHSYSSTNYLTTWLAAFHMPFFFIVTGILYGKRKAEGKDIKFNTDGKIKTLLVPYFIWGTVYQIFVSVLAIIGGAPVIETIKLRTMLIFTLQSGVMWFLPVMFIALLIFVLTSQNKVISILACIVSLIVGIYVPHSSDIVEAFLRPLPAVFFLGVGFYGYKFFSTKNNPVIVAIAFISTIIFVFMGSNIGMSYRTFGDIPFLAVLKGIIGTYTILQISMIADSLSIDSTLLEVWGRQSIIVMCLHPFPVQIIRLLDHFLFNDRMFNWGIAEGFLITSITVAIITLSLPVIIKYLGWTWGMKNKDDFRLKAS